MATTIQMSGELRSWVASACEMAGEDEVLNGKTRSSLGRIGSRITISSVNRNEIPAMICALASVAQSTAEVDTEALHLIKQLAQQFM